MSMHADIYQAIKNAASVIKRRARLARAYVNVWESPEGKIMFNDLFDQCGILTDVQSPASEDERSYAAGQRSIAIHIIQRLKWSEGELVQLARQQTTDAIEGLSGEEL